MKFLKSQNADIYQLQEVIPPRGKGNVDTKIFNKYFPDYTIIAHHELVTLSRLAVTDSEYREPNDFQRVTVNLDGKGVDFYNVHMRIHLLPELYRQPVEFLRETKERYNWRHEQFRQLLDGVKKSEKAYISGDFNTSKTMGMMRPLQEVTKDSFSQSSDVFPVTWDMKGNSWWRIDYNLVKGIELLKHENVEQAEYSDHRAQRVFIDID
ncbi:MAG: endonuclease/exonuclease/phosphatase family protein [Candidatus Gracilibacteria bacterium]